MKTIPKRLRKQASILCTPYFKYSIHLIILINLLPKKPNNPTYFPTKEPLSENQTSITPYSYSSIPSNPYSICRIHPKSDIHISIPPSPTSSSTPLSRPHPLNPQPEYSHLQPSPQNRLCHPADVYQSITTMTLFQLQSRKTLH